MSATPRRPAIDAGNREFASIRQAIIQYIQDKRPDLWNSFYHSDFGTFLIDMVAAHGDMQSFITDRVGEEAFLATAQEYRSMMNFARMLSYRVRGITAASATLVGTGVPVNFNLEAVEIKKGTPVPVGVGLSFEVDRDYWFNVGTPSEEYRFTVIEGSSVQEMFVADGSPFFRFRTAADSVIDRSWNVFVDDDPWLPVDFVELETGDTKTYSAEYDADGQVNFRFGDGIRGAIPVPGAFIRVEFRVGGGPRGNVGSGVITSTVTVNRVPSGSATLHVTNPKPASGGSDAESIDHIRQWAPLNAKTVDKCVGLQDYITKATSFSSPTHGAVARATVAMRPGTLLTPETGAFDTVSVAGHDPVLDANTSETQGIGKSTSPKAAIKFVTAAPVVVRTAMVRMERYGSPSDVLLRIETDLAGAPSGVLASPLAEAVLPASMIYGNTWTVATFANNVGLPAGVYWLTFTASGSLDSYYTLAGSSTAAPDTEARILYGGSWELSPEVKAAAFRVQTGGSWVIPAGSSVTINGQNYKTASPIAVDEKNLSLFVDPNTVDIHVWVETTGADGRRTFGSASSGLRDELLQYLNARSVITVVNHVADGPVRPVDINLGDVYVDATYARDAMVTAIHDAVESFFMSDRVQPGSPIRLSDLYVWIERVPGVNHFVERLHRDDIMAKPDEMLVRGNVTFNVRMSVFEDRLDIRAKY